MKRKNIFKSLLAAAMALIMIFGAAPLSGFVGIRLPMLSLKAEAATTEDGLFEYAVDRRWTGSEYEYGVRITRCDKNVSGKVVIPEAIEGYEVKWISSYAFSSCKNITEITIPDSVTEIGNSAFSGCTSLAEIVIPDSVTEIGEFAFSGCTALLKVVLSKNMTAIEAQTFSGCSSLESIIIPEGVTKIGTRSKSEDFMCDGAAFYGCTSLKEIIIPDSVTEIWWRAFSGCTSLSKVKLPKNLTSINSDVFSGCTSLAEITIPDSVTSIGSSAFEGCASLAEIVIPDSVTSIGGSAFSGCTSLAEIDIPDSVTEIGSSAFSGCTSLSKVDLPKKLSTIEAYTFSGCSSLESIVIPDGVTAIGTWSEYENTYYGSSFSGCKSLKEIVIPDSVTSIGSSAFSNCTSLESITIGRGVESLGDEWIASCRRLENITVSPENKTYSSVDGVLFNKDKSELSAYPIGNKRSSYTIPDGVEKIGKKAFYGCRYIESLTIPVSVAEIEASALGNCYDIRAVYYLGTREQWKEVVIGADNYMFALVNVRCADDSQCRHVWGEWEVVEEATYEKDGLERRVCSLCKAEQTRKIPRLGAVKVDAIELSESEKKLNVGKSFTITATVKPDNAWNRTVTWSSSDPSIATVDENGTVTAIAKGEAIITAESADGVKAECKVTVEKKVAAIELSESEKTVFVGDTFTITATVKPEDAFNRTVTWSSSDPSIATVDENGTVTAIAKGESIIIAESTDGVKAGCKVTVEKKDGFFKTLLKIITAPFRAIINLFKKLFGK